MRDQKKWGRRTRRDIPDSDGGQGVTIGRKTVLSASGKRKEEVSGDERRTRSSKVRWISRVINHRPPVVERLWISAQPT